MAIRAMQATLQGRWRSSPRIIALVVCGVAVVGCAEFGDFRSDMARLRADLNAHHTTLAALTERINALERRGATSQGGTAHTVPPESQQAVEVLLKKALEIDTRVSHLEDAKVAAPRGEKPSRSIVQPSMETRGDAVDGRKEISLGMTQEEVWRLFGEPLRTEHAGQYIFWQYSPMRDQKYVVFDRQGGRVSGWRGL